eukprot:COSAG05_NODE_1_length_66591_cov_307.301581_48_plen_109_part_00
MGALAAMPEVPTDDARRRAMLQSWLHFIFVLSLIIGVMAGIVVGLNSTGDIPEVRLPRLAERAAPSHPIATNAVFPVGVHVCRTLSSCTPSAARRSSSAGSSALVAPT